MAARGDESEHDGEEAQKRWWCGRDKCLEKVARRTSQGETGDQWRHGWNWGDADNETTKRGQDDVRTKWVELVFVSLVSRLQKDHNQTGPRLEKTGPAVWSFDFWESKTIKRLVFMDRSLWCPVSRPQKDCNQTRPRLEKTRPAVQSFDFWESKTAKRLVFMDRSKPVNLYSWPSPTKWAQDHSKQSRFDWEIN